MSIENNDNLENINNVKNDIPLNETAIKVKNLLKKLLQNSLGTQLLKLEKKSSEDFSNIKIISKNYGEFSKKIHFFEKKVEEAIKKKEKEKEKTKRINAKNDKKNKNNNISKRTLSSNNIKKNFNTKSHKTIMTEEELDKLEYSKNRNTVERGKTTCSNKIQLRTISNFKSIPKKEKEKEKTKEKEKDKEINSYNQKKPKINEIPNLKKYKTTVNKNVLKKGTGTMNQSDIIFINTINKISIKRYEGSSLNNSVRNSKIIKDVNYSYDRSNMNTLSDIEEKTEKKHNNNNNNSIIRKNKFKDKEEKKPITINKYKQENKNDKQTKDLNNKIQITINESINNFDKKEIIIENNNNTISLDQEIKHSKTNNFNTNNNSINNTSNDKKDNIQLSVKNIVKLVDDVNQSINKILLDGSQSQFQRRYSIRENSKSFIANKNIEIKEFLNKSPEKVIEEKENIQSYNDVQKPSTGKNKNLNLKCKINYNVFSNENKVRKIKNKIKNNNNTNNNQNNNNIINSSMNKSIINTRRKELESYNSYRNKKAIKKIILKSDKNVIEEDEKNNNSNINNTTSPIVIKERKINKSFEVTTNNNINNISFINIFKDNPKILYTILQYLSFKNKIYFLSINKFLSKERTSLLSNKKEELILILQLKEN